MNLVLLFVVSNKGIDFLELLLILLVSEFKSATFNIIEPK